MSFLPRTGLGLKLWLFNATCGKSDKLTNASKSSPSNDLKSSLHKFSQLRLIYRIIKYSNEMVDANGNKTLDYNFPKYSDRVLRRSDMRILEGLCHGLTHMFLFSAFISDVKDLENQNDDQERDDLQWFYNCIQLLYSKVKFAKFTPSQHNDILRFISLVRHFQNRTTTPPYNMDGNLFLDLEQSIFDHPTMRYHTRHHPKYQSNHVDNVEFTGDNVISFDAEHHTEKLVNSESDALMSLLERPGPLYVKIWFYFEETLKDGRNQYFWTSGHMVCLHKDKENNYTYFDPAQGFRDIKLNTAEQMTTFKNQIKTHYPNAKEIQFKVGVIKPKEKNSLNISSI